MRKQDYYWYWLTNINGIGRRTIQRLLDIYGTPEAVYWENEEKVSACFRNIKQKEAFSMSKREDYIIHSYQKLAGKGISFIHRDMQCYPKKLRDIPDAPFSLYLKGSFPPENQKNVAVIGARNCTRYGSEIARFFARELSKYGIGIISGLARGIDGMAHAGALEEEGYTLGVLDAELTGFIRRRITGFLCRWRKPEEFYPKIILAFCRHRDYFLRETV